MGNRRLQQRPVPEHVPEGYRRIGARSLVHEFAGYAYKRLGFEAGEDDTTSMFYSGYRLRKWSITGKGVGRKAPQITASERTVAAEASTGQLIDKGEWKALRKDLKKAKDAKARTQVAEEFFETRPQPQSGDILVKPRGKRKNNEFTGGKSHTMLVDRFDATNLVIYTVEGNTANKIGARKIDLTDPDDVGGIVFLARIGTEYFGNGSAAAEVAPGPFERLLLSRVMLVGGMQVVNGALVQINAEQGWIKTSDPDATVLEWVEGSAESTGAANASET